MHVKNYCSEVSSLYGCQDYACLDIYAVYTRSKQVLMVDFVEYCIVQVIIILSACDYSYEHCLVLISTQFETFKSVLCRLLTSNGSRFVIAVSLLLDLHH